MFIFISLYALAGFIVAVEIIRKKAASRREAARLEAIAEEKRRQEEHKASQARLAAIQREAALAEKERAAAVREAERQRKREAQKAAREAAEAERERKKAEKLEAARLLAEYNERALKAARDLQAIQSAGANIPQEKPETSEPVPEATEERPETISNGVQSVQPEPEAPRPFAGQIVAFTGRLKSMKRNEAIQRVKEAGGKAFPDFYSFSTILVVGSNPGQKKLDKFDNWIGQATKITEEQFLKMLEGA